MSKTENILFVSDIHLGANKPWDWFYRRNEAEDLVEFFNYLTNYWIRRKKIIEVVLLGDIFDLWVCPHDEKPHTFEEILTAQKDVIDAIKTMAGKFSTIYLNGNHDYRVTASDIKKAFEDKVKYRAKEYKNQNVPEVLGMHGHETAFFNNPDPLKTGISKLPIGYFLTRMDTTLGKEKGYWSEKLIQTIDELSKAAFSGKKTFTDAVLDGLRDIIREEHGIRVSSFKMVDPDNKLKYSDVKMSNKDLFEKCYDKYDLSETLEMIKRDITLLDDTAYDLCEGDTQIVVMGHSHKAKIEDKWLFETNKIYANCGCWCKSSEEGKEDDYARFVLTGGKKVELFHFKDGRARLEDCKEL